MASVTLVSIKCKPPSYERNQRMMRLYMRQYFRLAHGANTYGNR
jgi:hypothetical protein